MDMQSVLLSLFWIGLVLSCWMLFMGNLWIWLDKKVDAYRARKASKTDESNS